MVVCLVLRLIMPRVKSLKASHAWQKYAMWKKKCDFWNFLGRINIFVCQNVCFNMLIYGERGTSKSTGWSERVESSWGSDDGPADLQKTKGQGHEHVCHTGMPVRNGNLGTDRTTTTKAASVRKQLGTKNSKSDEGRQAKNGGVKGRDGSGLDT